MRVLSWASRVLVFLLLFAFAVKNTEPVSVRFLLGAVWHAPLIIVMLAFFVGGATLAVLSLLGTLFRLRREIAGLRAGLVDSASSAARMVPPEHPH
ncbi:MAG TPA: lipopolysaccharide assembly protein LapA domain-containing protein [Accumulibacter sp.]|nr:lipopolysaccharide assembly protein LapA domain-containing protein [Accumulibacter sp.]HMW16412.1 lipopolysaccharide assembly protein LapA domain-containing protein [Accumulibacter sp.]HMX21374.1 lipopolysaccharide assembly protein LapA domain-containing protein [Accumulibacter sp.]HMY07088.1 lipopolysaccharide assembly protein LapA domain-containing protein [Accumulibacter sp.]HNC16642.1 lipopolysaccharide assembly protein LapA domain-containing protein [Accumulibacter sp.]